MVITGTISIISFITLIIIVALYANIMSVVTIINILIIAFSIFIIGIYSAMQSEWKYLNFESLFVPNIKNYIFAVYIFSIRKLKCLHCGIKKYCKKVMSENN